MSDSFSKYLFVTVTSFCVFCLDQATKIYVHTQIPRENPISLIDGFFNISYVTNSGGAFGFLNNGPEWVRIILFLIFPLFCFGFIFIMLKETSHRLQVLALALILGGAVGNYVDRLRLGYVVDFIDWHVKGWHWPTFNLADSFIVIGVTVLSFFYLKESVSSPSK